MAIKPGRSIIIIIITTIVGSNYSYFIYVANSYNMSKRNLPDIYIYIYIYIYIICPSRRPKGAGAGIYIRQISRVLMLQLMYIHTQTRSGDSRTEIQGAKVLYDD